MLDEADRMLDMGFEREMKKIANYVHGGKPKRASQQQQHSYDFHNEDLTKIKRNKEVALSKTTIMKRTNGFASLSWPLCHHKSMF